MLPMVEPKQRLRMNSCQKLLGFLCVAIAPKTQDPRSDLQQRSMMHIGHYSREVWINCYRNHRADMKQHFRLLNQARRIVKVRTNSNLVINTYST